MAFDDEVNKRDRKGIEGEEDEGWGCEVGEETRVEGILRERKAQATHVRLIYGRAHPQPSPPKVRFGRPACSTASANLAL